ncbi:MAG: hypothetical protein WAO91_07425 [Candidatus Nitrosotenuis sp.]
MSYLKVAQHRQMLEKWAAKEEIELFVIINNSGRVIDSFGEGDLSISEEKKHLLLMQVALQSSMQGDHNEEFGKVRSCIIQRNVLKFICCPISEDKTALVVANKATPDIDIINHINQLEDEAYTVSKGMPLLI